MAQQSRYLYSLSTYGVSAAVAAVAVAVLLSAQGPGAPGGVAVTARGATPTITSLSVSTGAVGDPVTITGRGFGALQGTGSVTFNGTTATITSWTALSIVTAVPSGATTGNIVVTATNGLMSVGTAFTVVGAATGPIAAARLPGGDATVPNPDWALVGATITSPAQCGSQLASSSTVAQVNTAITNCSNAGGGFVNLASGTFTLAGTVKLASNVVLRGQGMSTILNITSTNGSNWVLLEGALTMVGPFFSGNDGAPTQFKAPTANYRTWSGTNGASGVYTQGATVLNLATACGCAVGDTIAVWQDNETIAPNANLWFSLVTSGSLTPPAGTVWQGSTYGSYGALEQRAVVTAVSGTQVTITPGIIFSTGHFKTRLNPQFAWWAGTSQQLRNAGLENLRVNTTSLGPINCSLCIAFCRDCWIKGVAVFPKTGAVSASSDYVIKVVDSQHVTVKDNWIGPAAGGGHFTATTYSLSTGASSHLLIQNNICNSAEQCITIEVATHGSVFAYNYDNFTGGEGGLEHHEVGASYNLIEGNNLEKATSDLFHGNTNLETFFRNHFHGPRGLDAWSYHRWYNIVGNVFNNTAAEDGQVYKTLNTDAMLYNRWSGYALRLGYPQQDHFNTGLCNGIPSGGCVLQDSVVWQSAMIWGNYDLTGGNHFLNAEVPTTDPLFPNPVPSSQALPNSYYLSAKPAWFGSAPWPLIGPDVTGGNVTGLAGHANKTPAQLCYEAAGGNVANFNSTNCPYLGL